MDIKDYSAITPEVKQLFERGCQALAKKNYDAAIHFFSLALRSFPQSASILFNRGLAFYHKGNFPAAIQDYTESLQLKPTSAKIYNNRGLCYQSLKNHQKAVADFSKAIELNPDFAGAYYNRASAYFSLNDFERAWQDLQKARALGYPVNQAFWDSVLKSRFQGQLDFLVGRVRSFQLKEGYLPRSLQELVLKGYLSCLPELPINLKFVYQPESGKVSIRVE